MTNPTTCRDTAQGRRYQLIYQRARGRAVARLIRAHQDEYDALLADEKQHAQAEADALDLTATQQGEKHGDEPARLKSGRKARGQTVLDRIDVGRCPHCIKHHDAGHKCAVCGAKPGDKPTPPRPQRRVVQPVQVPRTRRTTVDPAALAEFNAGTQRAAKAARR